MQRSWLGCIILKGPQCFSSGTFQAVRLFFVSCRQMKNNKCRNKKVNQFLSPKINQIWPWLCHIRGLWIWQHSGYDNTAWEPYGWLSLQYFVYAIVFTTPAEVMLLRVFFLSKNKNLTRDSKKGIEILIEGKPYCLLRVCVPFHGGYDAPLSIARLQQALPKCMETHSFTDCECIPSRYQCQRQKCDQQASQIGRQLLNFQSSLRFEDPF